MFENISLIPEWIMALFFFVQGSFFGSFANVLIYRAIHEKPVNLFTKSHCPHCLYNIPFYLNIPILSWLILRGVCANCGKSFSFRYPLVEFLTALSFSALFLAIGWKWFLLEALLFAFALIVASFIDWDQMILPDFLTLSGLAIGLLGAGINPERPFLEAFLGALLGGGFLALVAFVYYWLRRKEGLGGGDIKMIAWIGAVLGWPALPFVILSSCFLGSLAGAAIMARGNKSLLRTAFPFGPFLAIGALLYIFASRLAAGFMAFFMPFSFF